MPEFSDADCLATLGANPRHPQDAERAFAALFERYDRRLQCHLRARFTSLKDDDLREVAQDTWLRAWRNLDANIRPEALRSWLFRIGVNLAIDLIRKKAIRPEAALGDIEPASHHADLGHEIAFKEQLSRCVKLLPEKYHGFMGRLLNLDTPEDIALATNLPKSRVYQIKHEIGKLLSSCMEQAS